MVVLAKNNLKTGTDLKNVEILKRAAPTERNSNEKETNKKKKTKRAKLNSFGT